MNNNNIPFYYSENRLQLIVDGKTFSVPSSDDRLAEVRAIIDNTMLSLQDKKDQITRLLSVKEIVETLSDTINMVLDKDFRIINGVLTYEGFEITSKLADRIMKEICSGSDVGFLLNFFRNVENNPSFASRNSLFEFLTKNEFPFTIDGCFLGYKAVKADFTDKYSGTFDNSPGKTVEIDRETVDPNRSQDCSAGLHVGNYEYVKGFGSQYGGDRWLIVKVNPADVVAVPNYDARKVRTCKYEVIAEVSQDYILDETVFTGEEFGLSWETSTPKGETVDLLDTETETTDRDSHIYETVKEIICAELGLETPAFSQDLRVREDLDADELDMVEIVLAIEDEFGIEISDADVDSLRTVRDLCSYIERLSEDEEAITVNVPLTPVYWDAIW